MIQGTVRGEEARIRLNVNGLRGREQQVEALIDTGYTGFLTLPPRLITALALRWRSVDRSTLADGGEYVFDVYDGSIVWGGIVRNIFVDEADAQPLVGMRLLKGYELNIQVRSHGKVRIKQIVRK